jgi:hypothetical protein
MNEYQILTPLRVGVNVAAPVSLLVGASREPGATASDRQRSCISLPHWRMTLARFCKQKLVSQQRYL